MRSALTEIAIEVSELAHIDRDDAVLDIGANDGTLLRSYHTPDIYRIGFEPALNLTEQCASVADKLVPEFFSADAFFADSDIKNRRPRAITSIAMFYDLDDPNTFVSDVKSVLHPDGVWVVQMSYLPLMLKQNAFDNVCHEHLEYYSLASLEFLLARHDFRVVDVDLNQINGGSIRAYIQNAQADERSFGDAVYRRLANERVHRLREREARLRLSDLTTYRSFATQVERVKHDVSDFVHTEVARDQKVYVYGASTKGNTLLQYFELDGSLITAAAERNPDKWGRVTIGTRIPIVSEDQAREARPDYFLVLPWHFLDEFQERERDYLLEGGRFIVPLPHFMLI